MITSVKINACCTASINFGGVVFSISIHNQVFNLGILYFVATNDRKNGGREAAIRDHDVSVHRAGESKVVIFFIEDGCTDSMEITLRIGSDINSAANGETFEMLNGDCRLAEIAVSYKRGSILDILLENGLAWRASNRNTTAQVQGIPHEKFSGTDFYRSASKVANIIYCSLQCPIIRADNFCILKSNRDLDRRKSVKFILRIATSCLIPKSMKATDKTEKYKILF